METYIPLTDVLNYGIQRDILKQKNRENITISNKIGSDPRLHKLTYNQIKVNGFNIKGSNSVIFILASFLNGSYLSKERICPFWSKFFPLRINPILERLSQPRETNRKS